VLSKLVPTGGSNGDSTSDSDHADIEQATLDGIVLIREPEDLIGEERPIGANF